MPATVLALLATFVLRFAGTEALVYLPKRKWGRSRGRTAGTADADAADAAGPESAGASRTVSATRTGRSG